MILIGRGLDCTQSLGRLIGEKAKKFKSEKLCSCQGARKESGMHHIDSILKRKVLTIKAEYGSITLLQIAKVIC